MNCTNLNTNSRFVFKYLVGHLISTANTVSVIVKVCKSFLQ